MTSTYSEAFQAGRQARRDGEPVTANPHVGSSDMDQRFATAWLEGWRATDDTIRALEGSGFATA